MTHTFTPRQAAAEAERCLQCFDAPCMHTCPARVNIPAFIAMIKSGNIRGAAEVVRSSNALINVCGKICPEEVFCQSVCNRAKQGTPVSIRELHFFATQTEAAAGYSAVRPFEKNGKRVAVIGAGPAGLSCAFELAKLGYDAEVFEQAEAGGVPRSSIPAFRLTEKELASDVAFLSRHFTIRKETITPARFEGLRKEYSAVFVGVGLGLDKTLPIPGLSLRGVYPVLEYLEDAKQSSPAINPGKRVIIVGGGNVSLDAAATAKRRGASQVILIYRRGEREMKVWKSELDEARAQGVEIRFMTAPVAVVGTRTVEGLKCIRTELSDKRDASGRQVPVEVPGSEFVLPADTILAAVGQVMKPGFADALKKNAGGFLVVDETMAASERGVFAGGDAISGEGTIVQSVGNGKTAAHSIHNYCTGR